MESDQSADGKDIATAGTGSVTETRQRSTPQGAGFSVAPSPFNGVKLDLAIALVAGLLLLLVVLSGRLPVSAWLQNAALGSYGLISCAWLIFRVRRIMEARPAGQGR